MPEGKLPPDFFVVVAPTVFIFLAIFTSPIWYNAAFGQVEWNQPEPPSTGDECILPTADIRLEHMELLDDWRDEVVREGMRNRGDKMVNGEVVQGDLERAEGYPEKSLTDTCLGCHTNRETFCDRCHEFVGEDPYCWDCHVDSAKAPSSRRARRDEGRREGGER